MYALDLKQLQAFTTVLELRSFDKAAKALNLTQSAISQRVKQLEEQLGQPLIIRSNPLVPTEAGQRVLRRARQIALLQDELWEELGHQRSAHIKVSIGLNADSLSTWFLDAVQPILDKYKLLIELKVEDQEQTHKLLMSGQVMGCVSASKLSMQGCNCEPLGEMRYCAVASRRYISRYFSDGVRSDAFLKAPMVAFNTVDQLQWVYLQQHFGLKDKSIPLHQVPTPDSYIDFIGRGMAWGMLPEIHFQKWQQQYDLQNLSPDKTIAVPLYWRSWNLKSPFVRELSRTIVDHATLALR